MVPLPGRLSGLEGMLVGEGTGVSILPLEGESEGKTVGTEMSLCRSGLVREGMSTFGGGAKLSAAGRVIKNPAPCLELQSALASRACSGIDSQSEPLE